MQKWTADTLFRKSNLEKKNWGMLILSVMLFALYSFVIAHYKKYQIATVLAYIICLGAQLYFLINMLLNKFRMDDIRDGKFVIYKTVKDGKSLWVFKDQYVEFYELPGDVELDDYLKSRIIK